MGAQRPSQPADSGDLRMRTSINSAKILPGFRKGGIFFLAFVAGAAVGAVSILHHASFLTTEELLRELGAVPKGRLEPGTYWVTSPRGKHILLELDVGAAVNNSQSAGNVTLSSGPGGHGCFFCYQFKDRYGLPEAYLLTGPSGRSNSWTDIGLTGHFALKYVANRPYAHINGSWVPLRYGMYALANGKAVLLKKGGIPASQNPDEITTLAGNRYRFDQGTASWKEVARH